MIRLLTGKLLDYLKRVFSLPDRKVEYFVDESRIVAEHDRIISEAQNLTDHIDILNATLRTVHQVLVSREHEDDDELIVQRLVIRAFNDIASGLKLARCGYFQVAISSIRDLVETSFLLDLFFKDPTSINQWSQSTAKERMKNYSAFQVRERLKEFDENDQLDRSFRYKMFSNYGTHPTPEGFSVISPDLMTKIGPFPSERALTAVVEELTMQAIHLGALFSAMFSEIAPEIAHVFDPFLDSAQNWRKKYMPKPEEANQEDE